MRAWLAEASVCITVGLFEEALFRMIIQDALVTLFGSTRRGVLVAFIVLSLIFGGVTDLILPVVVCLIQLPMVFKSTEDPVAGNIFLEAQKELGK